MFFMGIIRHIAGSFLSHLAFFIGSNCTNAFLYSFYCLLLHNVKNSFAFAYFK